MLYNLPTVNETDDRDVLDILKSFNIPEVTQLLNDLVYGWNNVFERKELADKIVKILNENNLNTDKIEVGINDLVID